MGRLLKNLQLMLISCFVFFCFTCPVLAYQEPGYRVEVGEEEYVFGPVNKYGDSSYLAVPVSSGVQAYSANGATYWFKGPSLENLSVQGVTMDVGTSGKFDECGRWLK
jgi:hypothetical protein